MTDLREFEDDFAHALARLVHRTRFVELLAELEEGEEVRIDRRSLTPSLDPRIQGAVIRAWGGERWVEAATSALNRASLDQAAASVERGVSKSATGAAPPGESATTRGEWAERPARPMRSLGSEAMISLARDAFSWAIAVPGVKDCQVEVGWSENQRFYLNSAGARCFQLISRVGANVAPIAIENGRVEYDYLSRGYIGGQERLGFLSQERVADVAKGTVELLHARAPPTGEMSVLLDQGTTGTLAHESFGHGTEADQFLRDRSYLRPILGQTVGPESLTIIDQGSHPDGWGTFYFDDEGHLGQRTVLIDRGKFIGALHDRETAAALHVSATGNARRSDFLSRLFVRMTNTYVEPGDWTFDELVREAKNGVVLEHCTSGIEDPLGGQMQIKVKKGRKIENGQLTDLVSSMALSGKVLEVLRQIKGLSRPGDFEMSPGYCGKGHTDLLPVGSGGTFLLSTAVVGPA